MTHIPIRGLFQLTRMAVVVAGMAAVPYILKKNKKLAEQLGETLVKAGERLKSEGAVAEPPVAETKSEATAEKPAATATVAEPPVAEPKKEEKPKAKKAAVKTSAKPPAAKKTVVKAKKSSTPRSKS